MCAKFVIKPDNFHILSDYSGSILPKKEHATKLKDTLNLNAPGERLTTLIAKSEGENLVGRKKNNKKKEAPLPQQSVTFLWRRTYESHFVVK